MADEEHGPTPHDTHPLALVHQWRCVVDTQMHFNDMIMRTRALGISVVTGVYGAAAVSIGQYPARTVEVCGSSIHISAIVMAFGVVLLVSLALLDAGYYYKLLLGAVERGEQLEEELRPISARVGLPQFDVTAHLSRAVGRRRAATVVVLFYGLPFLIGSLFLLVSWQLLPTE